MKFIHTADWHLGKLLKEHAMTEDQAWLLENRFLPLLDREKPEVVLLAGDVYDRSFPPEEAVELFDRMTEEIVGKRRIPFIVISGNHDSAERLSVASRLLSRQGLYIFGPLELLRPVYIKDEWGEVAVIPLPYADPARVRVMMNHKGLPDADKVRTYEEAEQAMVDYGLSLLPEEKKQLRKVAVAHVFAAGGTPAESERPLSIGGYDRISDAVFKPFCYTALGHLHGPQKTTAQSEAIQYSGSLLRYSFGEVNQKKGVILGQIDDAGHVSCRFEELTPRYEVRQMTGTFKELMDDDVPSSPDYLQIILTDSEPVIDAMPRLRAKYPNALGVVQDMGYREDSGKRDIYLETMSDQDIFKKFVSQFRESGLTEDEEQLANQVWDAVYKKEAER